MSKADCVDVWRSYRDLIEVEELVASDGLSALHTHCMLWAQENVLSHIPFIIPA